MKEIRTQKVSLHSYFDRSIKIFFWWELSQFFISTLLIKMFFCYWREKLITVISRATFFNSQFFGSKLVVFEKVMDTE